MDSFKGTSAEQDIRFGDKERKLLKSTKFPPQLATKVDMRKVELSVMKPWIAKKVNDLLGFEDEVVIEYANGLLEDTANPVVDGKKVYIKLLGFLDKHTDPFMSELWTLLLSAQESPVKVPAIFIEQKKEEMRQRELEKSRNEELALVRKQAEENRDRKIEEIRLKERGNREQRQNYHNDRSNQRDRRDNRDSSHRNAGPSDRRRDDYRDRGYDRRNDDRRNDDRGYRSRKEDRRRSRSRSRSPPRKRRSPSYEAKKDSTSGKGGDITPKYDRNDAEGSQTPPRRRRRRSTSSPSRSPPRRRGSP